MSPPVPQSVPPAAGAMLPATVALYRSADAAWRLLASDRHLLQNWRLVEEVREQLRKDLKRVEDAYPNLVEPSVARDLERSEGLTTIMEEE